MIVQQYFWYQILVDGGKMRLDHFPKQKCLMLSKLSDIIILVGERVVLDNRHCKAFHSPEQAGP